MDINSHLRTTRRAALLGAAALAALACGRELEPEVRAPDSTLIIHFRASEADTRAVFGEEENGSRPTLWTSNDQQVKLSLNHGSAIPAGITPSSDFRTATFSAQVDFTNVDGPYTYYAVSPASAASALSPSRTAWKVTIPCEQTPTESSVDESAIILASKSESFSQASQVNVVDLFFNHLTAYGRLSLSNLSLSYNASVSYIELTTETPIVGDWYWKTANASITDYGASSTLKIITSRTSDIWFACAPVDMSNKKMTVRVYTNNNRVYTKQVTFPAERQFEAGKAAVFTVNMSGVTGTYIGSADAMLSRSDYGCYLGSNDLTRTLDISTDQVTRSYDANDVLTYTLVNASAVEELSLTGYKKSMRKGDSVTITVYWRQGLTVKHGESYTMSILKEEGAKVWIGDGTGKGFIIKK